MTPEPTRGSAVVAIIDDEEDITTYLRVALEDCGYSVVSTTDAAAAIELLDGSKPDLVCLDLLMPEQTGISLYANLIEHPRLAKTPIVILSGLALREELPGMLERAGNLPEPAGFIEKPVDLALFLDTVARLVARPVGSQT